MTLKKIANYFRQPNYWSERNIIHLVWFFIFLLIWLVVVPIIWQSFKLGRVVISTQKELAAIEQAVKINNWSAVARSLSQLESNLTTSEQALMGLGPVRLIPAINRNLLASRQLINSGYHLVSGYRRAAELIADLNGSFTEENLVLNFASASSRQEILKFLKNNQEALLATEEEITLAEKGLNQVSTNYFSGLFQKPLLAVNGVLQEVVDNTQIAWPIVSRLPDLAGYGQEKHYLFLFQNNMEMRPTGGFIGSYGVITIKDGEVIDLFTDDIYNLDKLSIGKLNAPAPTPMVRYLNQKNWFLRDANWSPDWPTSAEKILWFYNEERKNAGLSPQKIDGVLAITPDFIANLLEVIGPTTVDNVIFKSENFATVLEQFVEFDYVHRDIHSSDRKDIIGKLAQTLLQEIYQAPTEDLLKLWLAFKENINEKHILVYLTDPAVQDYFNGKNWSGMIKHTDGDYFFAVDSNLAALKTDSVMDKSITYSLAVNDQGELIGRATLTYQHKGEIVSGLISKYRDYLRFYVPADTWFISVYAEENGQRTDLKILKDVEVAEELGKKYAAVFFTVEPQSTKKVIFEYRLPENIRKQAENGSYQLLVQKQPGTSGHKLKIDLNFKERIKSYHFNQLPEVVSGSGISWRTDLTEDREFEVKLK